MSARTLGIRLIGTAALALSVAACGAFGPVRTPPQMASPGRYAAADQPLEMSAAGGDREAQHLRAGARPVPEWWREYGSDTLNALVDEGLKNSPSLAAAQSTLEAAREGLRAQIGQSLWPSVDVGFSPSRQRALAIPTLPEQTFLYNVFAAEVKTSYTFDFFGAAVLADRALAQQVQQQDYQLESVRRALAANIVVATIDAASLQEQVAATEELAALGERRAQQTAARYALGSASLDDNLAAQEDAAVTAAALPPLRAVSLEEDANALAQSERAANAARDLDRDAQTRYHLGASPLYAALTARQQYESANVQYVRARAARLADTAALFVSMGNPPAGGQR